MRTVAIEFNDAGIAVADAQGVLAIEPGCAVVERDKILTGREAVAKARLKPRQASNRFWNSLSLEPGSAGSEIAQSAAELASRFAMHRVPHTQVSSQGVVELLLAG